MSYAGNDDVERLAARTSLGETMTASEVRPVGLRRTTTERGDRIRWGPIITGALVAVATYLLLELVLVAAEVLDRDLGGALPDGAWWTLVAAVVAFFVGGLVAGASIGSRASDDGFLHGIGVWALATVVFLVVAVIGTGLALGTLGHALDRLGDDGSAEQAAADDDDRSESAGTAALALGATALAAGVGGAVGAKLWPRAQRDTLTFGENELRQSASS